MRPAIVLIICSLAALALATTALAAPAAHALPPQPAPALDDAEVQFRVHCAACHDVNGAGTGRAAANLRPPPADLTTGVFKRHLTPPGALPSDDDLLRVLRKGVPGTAMPSFADVLSSQQLRDLVAYVKTLSPRFAGAHVPAEQQPPAVPLGGEAAIAIGQALFHDEGCVQCHGEGGRGDVAQAEFVPDLSAPWALPAGSRAEDLYRTITAGVDGTPMVGYERQLSEGERWELVFYIRSLARTPIWSQSDPARVLALPAGGRADPVRRGAYLVRALGCGRCHTPTNSDGTYAADRALSGGTRITAWPYGTFYSSNLTSDYASGLGSWSQSQIVAALTSGQTPGLQLQRLNPAVMPWPYYARLHDEDASAIAAYLRTLAPIPNLVPPADGGGFFVTFGAKLQAFALGTPVTLEFAPGNAADPNPGRLAPLASVTHRLEPVIAAAMAMWLTLSCYGALVLVRRMPLEPLRHTVLRLSVAAVYVLLLLGSAALDLSPVYTYFPREAAAGAAAQMPPAVGLHDAAQAALAERGQYLATIGACASCHSPAPARLLARAPAPLSGGVRFNWAVYGTRYSRNLTPDATGVQGWDEADLRRAFASGQARDGRPLHWQAMPWDYLSNLTEEDAQALAFYLLHLAPQSHAVPPPEAPAPGDAELNRVTFGDFGH